MGRYFSTSPVRFRPGARGLLMGCLLLVLILSAARIQQPRNEQPVEVIEDTPLPIGQGGMLNGAEAQNVSSGPGGQATLPEHFYDFGVISAGETVEHGFLILNQGETPLVIRQAYTTCGCTTAILSTRVIPPGKAARARVIFDADFHDVRGTTVRRGLVLETSDPDQGQLEVWVQAAVR